MEYGEKREGGLVGGEGGAQIKKKGGEGELSIFTHWFLFKKYKNLQDYSTKPSA